MKKIYVIIYLISIASIASILRLIPSFNYYVWGVDFGIYYNILKSLSIQNLLYKPMNSIWGTSGYGYFPVPYIIMMGFHYLTGLSIHFIMMHFPQVFSSFTVIGIFLISKELTKFDLISLIASIMVAINPFDVFEESMIGLLIFGHVFLIFSILFLLLYIKYNKMKYLYFSFTFGILLMLSHHFSTLMFIIPLIFISIYYKNHKTLFYYVLIYTSIVFAYWLLFIPSMKFFFQYGLLGIPFYFVPTMFYLIYIILYLKINKIIELLKSYTHKFKLKNFKIFMNNLNTYLFALIVGLIVEILLLIGIEGIKINLNVFIFSLPFLLIISFSGPGFLNIKKYKNATFLLIWISSLTVVFLYSLFTWNGILIPYRFLEYIFEPMSIISGIGIYESYLVLNKKFNNYHNIKIININNNVYNISGLNINNGATYFRFYNTHPFLGNRLIIKNYGLNIITIFISILIIIFLFSTISVYPIVNQVNETSQNYITPLMMSALNYLIKYGNRNYSVATDAVDGLYLESFGFNSTFEYTYKLWTCENWTDAINELYGNNTYPKIGYVLINSNMFYNGIYGYELSTHPSYDPPIYLNNTTFYKFFKPPFYILYYNYTFNNSEWVYVFGVNWTYINNYLKDSN